MKKKRVVRAQHLIANRCETTGGRALAHPPSVET
jgi:hypothetical protein